MGLFANGDGHYSQGQRPWMNAQPAVFANGDIQPDNASVFIRSLFVPCFKPYTFRESKRGNAEIAEEDYQDELCVLSASAFKFLLGRKIERRKMEEDKGDSPTGSSE